MNKQQALNTIVRAIKKPDYMSSAREYRDTITLLSHPFIPKSDPGHPDLIDFTGFSSDDIYPFLFHLLGNYQPITGLTFWLCPQQEDKRQHQVFAEGRTEFSCYLVAGMTDYSGSGSHAYRELKNVFEFLAELNGIQVEYREVEPGRGDYALTVIGQQAAEQLAEEDELD